MNKIKIFKVKVVGLVASLGLFGCFYGNFCSATEQSNYVVVEDNNANEGVNYDAGKGAGNASVAEVEGANEGVNNNVGNGAGDVVSGNNNTNNAGNIVREINTLTGGIEFKGSNGSDARSLSEKDVVRIAVFMYALAKNYVREFGFKSDNAKGFMEKFLGNSTEYLNRNGFKLAIKDLVSANATKEQIQAAEQMDKTGKYDIVMVRKEDFEKAKKEVLDIAKAKSSETSKKNKKFEKAKRKGEEGILELARNDVKERINQCKKESDNDKAKRWEKILNSNGMLKKFMKKTISKDMKLCGDLDDSLKQRVNEIKKLEYEDVKPLNNNMTFQYIKDEVKR